ncbi:MAG TPA: site-specific integrase, partial [Streptosporangiaceae bacterium]|nr:site-specific integrase [Streptosporangiaceae bacterium]
VGKRADNTRSNYEVALRPVRERLGQRKARTVTREDVEAFAGWMLTEGRRRGGVPGTALSARSVRLTVGRLSAAFDLAVKDRKLAHNPCQHAETPDYQPGERRTWDAARARRFLQAAQAHRLYGCWLLSLHGLRRGEVTGLRWDDIDLDGRKLTVASARVAVYQRGTVEKSPKSRRGVRTLPLTDAAVAALRQMQTRQKAERLAAGEAYAASGFVACDELGRPVSPRWYSDEFDRIRAQAKLPRITLHDLRHAANSLLADAGVPDHIRAAWCGHAVAVNASVYTHANDLSAARDALAVALGGQA